MDIATQPDIYTPSIDECNNYVDNKPSFNILKNGLLCPCGSRKDKTFHTNSNFSSHIKTKIHQKWLLELNMNKANYYVENEKNKEIIQNQKLIIAKLEKDINVKIMTIDYLTHQLNNQQNQNNHKETNLLEFD
jgi:hypothetical protein